MNKIWSIGFIFFILILGFYVYKNYILDPIVYDDISPVISQIIENKPKGNNFTDISFKGTQFRVAWIKIENPASLSLFSNLPNSESAEKRMNEKLCKYLVNGGFYSKESRPIGVFISEGEKINNAQRNILFNGVFSIDNHNVPRINSDLNENNVRFAVQSGPILIIEGQLQQINLRSDSQDRRTVVAITNNNHLIFISIYKPNSVYLGPYLAEVPDILNEFEKKTVNNITFALNLDGGTASAFYSDSVSLPELSPIGSYFCIKN